MKEMIENIKSKRMNRNEFIHNVCRLYGIEYEYHFGDDLNKIYNQIIDKNSTRNAKLRVANEKLRENGIKTVDEIWPN
jgi:hypothetical protein